MEIEFDPDKDVENLKKHGLSLAMAQDVDWDHAITWPDNRFEYEESRMNALVPMGNRLYFVAYVERKEKLRPISLRYATNPEKKRYAEQFR